ncbi:MAG: GIY-YIG nuclease family protein [bacterium]|nr:GIY-YIG nuclease family protein [bacterium]
MSKYYFYIARCSDGSLYIGSTNNPSSRIMRHNFGFGSKWVKQHGAAEIVYTEDYNILLEVRRRELQVKKWSRVKKENLILGKWGKLK